MVFSLKKECFMRHVLRSLLVGALLLSALAFVSSGSPQVFAASSATHVNNSHSLYHPYPYYNPYDYSQNYRQGYQDGYSDCQHQFPPANTYNQGYGYSDGYDAGYQFCQSKRSQGHIKGYQDGYQDGENTCTQEHEKNIYAKKS